MKARDVMTKGLHSVRADATIHDAAERMRREDVGSLPVLAEDDSVVGLVTDRDLVVRGIVREGDASTRKVGDVMSSPLICCRDSDELADVSATMKAKRVRRVLVLGQSSEPVGIVSLGDLARSSTDRAELTSVVRYVSSPEVSVSR